MIVFYNERLEELGRLVQRETGLVATTPAIQRVLDSGRASRMTDAEIWVHYVEWSNGYVRSRLVQS